MAEPNGLYYMRARYYDPSVGRFISEDPLGFGGGDVNLYAYVQNNPVNEVDPDGLISPVRPPRARVRNCNGEEYTACQQKCGAKGVESCKICQTFRVTGMKDGLTVWGWKDGPMSCSCRDVESCPQKIRDALRDFNDFMQKVFPDPNQHPNGIESYPPPFGGGMVPVFP